MVDSEVFPYVEGKHGAEGDGHVRLKGLAVYWLLQRGFNLGDITEEYPVTPDNASGSGNTRYADLYADDGERNAYIECERGSLTPRSVSLAGRQKAERGETVFVFGDDGIYRLHLEEVDHEGLEEAANRPTLTRLSELPMLDLSAYQND